MLKKVLLWSTYTYHISFADSLSVRRRCEVSAVVVGYDIFFDPVSVKKNFCPLHFLGACERLNEKGFLCSDLFGLFLGFDGISSMVPELFSE